MSDGENKRNPIDHVEIVDAIAEVNDLSVDNDNDNENEEQATVNSNIISMDDLSKLFKGRNLSFVSTLSDDGSPYMLLQCGQISMMKIIF